MLFFSRFFVRPLRIFGGLAVLTLKRLRSQPGLALLSLLQIVLSVGLLTSAGFFAQAVDRVILQQELDRLSSVTNRPPFSTRVYFFPSSRKPMDVASAEAAGRSIAGTLSAEIGLPIAQAITQLESGNMMLMPPPNDIRYNSDSSFLATTNLVYIQNVGPQLNILAGDPLDDDGHSEADALDVWMHQTMAAHLGLGVGESFTIAPTVNQPPTLIRVRGVWQAADPDAPFWFRNPDTALKDVLLVRRLDYTERIQPLISGSSRFASWQISLDDSRLDPASARAYAEGFERGMAVVNKYVPGANLDVSALDSLKEFVGRKTALTVLLLGFNIPALGFLFYFLILISAIIARSQQRETSLMVSRGARVADILSLVAVEEFLLFVVGTPLGMAWGMALALGMGYTDSFLTFTQRPLLPVSLQGINYSLIGVALAVSLVARLLPAFRSTRKSIVDYESSYGRPQESPLWRRAYLDFLLIVPTAYAYQQLGNRGALALLVQDNTDELFQDPLLLLVPALFIFTASLLVMRLFPLLMNLLDALASSLPWTAPHLALRQLGRHSHSYLNPLLLVVICLGLGIYAHSMAASLDQWLIDRVYYQVGADIAFTPYNESAEGGLGGEWIPQISAFAELPGVEKATRVGDYKARNGIPGSPSRAIRFLAVDRAEFASTAWFRPDFAGESLGSLMNRLATSGDSILVSEQFLADNLLKIGDVIPLWVTLDAGIRVQSGFTVVGVYHLFPTTEEEENAVIGNLDYLSLLGGAVFPHNIWLRTSGDVDSKELMRSMQQIGIDAPNWKESRAIIAAEKAKTERIGIFGTLTVGFLAAALMALLALLVHSYASLQERLFQFGVLRAIGALRQQLVAQLSIEYSLLVLYGTVAGSLIGAYTSELFTPFFRSASQSKVMLPPLRPIIAQDEIFRLTLIFAVVIILVELLATAQAMQRRLFEIMRMGHQG
ncbi:MAG: ABC transporter permease [Caldilineaceae bacterium]|nr:ABC transporter permease [Caldilineaceae bacterium]